MNSRQALEASYEILSPHADSQRWEFDNNLFHLNFLVSRISKNEKIADLGCGIGILALALKLQDYDVTGIDKYVFEPSNSYSVGDIEKLKKIWQVHGLNITAGTIEHGAKKKEFDVVVSVAVIEHQKDLKSFMAGLGRHLSNGGKIYIATPNISNLLNRFRMVCGRPPIENVREFFEKGDSFVGHWREYTVRELRTIVSLAGFVILEAGNAQTLKPYMTSNWRKWHRLFLRGLARLIPGAGDTNYIWLKK